MKIAINKFTKILGEGELALFIAIVMVPLITWAAYNIGYQCATDTIYNEIVTNHVAHWEINSISGDKQFVWNSTNSISK